MNWRSHFRPGKGDKGISSGDSFSILGGLSFLTFLGVLLFQLATTSRRSLTVDDLDRPLQLSDLVR